MRRREFIALLGQRDGRVPANCHIRKHPSCRIAQLVLPLATTLRLGRDQPRPDGDREGLPRGSIIATCHRRVAEVVECHEGYVAKYMGDGVLAYFGYPRAQENDAEHAAQQVSL